MRELVPFDLMIDRFVSATARWARSRSSSEVCTSTVGVAGFMGAGLETIRSVISSSSASAGICAGGERGESRGISTVVSFAKMRELIVGVVAFSSDSVGGRWMMGERGLGEGVVGVEELSSAHSPSSCKTLGGKKCEPVRGGLGRGWRVPIGEGRALMLAVLTLERSFISCSEVGVFLRFDEVYI